jgi:transposase
MRAYSIDLRERVLADCDAGLGTRAAAAKYRVSESWVRRLKQRRRETGAVAARAPRRPAPGWAAHADRLRAEVRARPDATLEELRGRLGLTASVSTVCRALKALGLTLKKSTAGRRAGPARCGGRAG